MKTKKKKVENPRLMQKGHPDPKIIRKLADKLERTINGRYLKCKRNFCNMGKGFVEIDCGTPGCHGGWWLMALSPKPLKKFWFSAGANLLARSLGFSGLVGLETWASRNPELWGNSYGGSMFLMPEAFDKKNKRFSAMVLVKWWRGVADRIENSGLRKNSGL